MAVEMVLNDLSLRSPVSERGIARQLMTDLIGVLSAAKITGVKTLRTLVMQKSPRSIPHCTFRPILRN
jgi:hypothetical protein